MRLVVSAVRSQFEPSSLSSAASLRDGLQRRAALGVNDATIAASSVRREHALDGVLQREQPAGFPSRFERGVGVRENHPLVLLPLVFPLADRAALLLGLDRAPPKSRSLRLPRIGGEGGEPGGAP